MPWPRWRMGALLEHKSGRGSSEPEGVPNIAKYEDERGTPARIALLVLIVPQARFRRRSLALFGHNAGRWVAKAECLTNVAQQEAQRRPPPLPHTIQIHRRHRRRVRVPCRLLSRLLHAATAFVHRVSCTAGSAQKAVQRPSWDLCIIVRFSTADPHFAWA